VIILLACLVVIIYGISKLESLLSRRERGLSTRRKRKKIEKGEGKK
jgi:Na+-transporting methylmalonyl-CoA/oxaloacetate decarboxylase gamma subunit